MRPQSIVAVVLALVFGGSAAMGVRNYVGSMPAARTDTVPVVVAKMTIPRGMLVGTDLVKTRDYPKDLVPTGAILKVEDVLDRSAYSTLVTDEPVLESKLSPKGQRGLASLVADGMRRLHDHDQHRLGRRRVHPPGQQGGRAPDRLERGHQRLHGRGQHHHAAPERGDPGGGPEGGGPGREQGQRR